MKWFTLILGTLLTLAGLGMLQISKGVTFTYGEFEDWDEAFLDHYRSCCLITDLKTAAPFVLVGIAFLLFSAWSFLRQYSIRREKVDI